MLDKIVVRRTGVKRKKKRKTEIDLQKRNAHTFNGWKYTKMVLLNGERHMKKQKEFHQQRKLFRFNLNLQCRSDDEVHPLNVGSETTTTYKKEDSHSRHCCVQFCTKIVRRCVGACKAPFIRSSFCTTIYYLFMNTTETHILSPRLKLFVCFCRSVQFAATRTAYRDAWITFALRDRLNLMLVRIVHTGKRTITMLYGAGWKCLTSRLL